MKTETEYLLQRASEEAHQAIRSEEPQAEAVHNALSVAYSTRAIIALSDEDDVVPEATHQEAVHD